MYQVDFLHTGYSAVQSDDDCCGNGMFGYVLNRLLDELLCGSSENPDQPETFQGKAHVSH